MAFATSFALRGVLNKILRDILKLTYFTVRDVVFVPESAGLKPLLWWRRRNNGKKGGY